MVEDRIGTHGTPTIDVTSSLSLSSTRLHVSPHRLVVTARTGGWWALRNQLVLRGAEAEGNPFSHYCCMPYQKPSSAAVAPALARTHPPTHTLSLSLYLSRSRFLCFSFFFREPNPGSPPRSACGFCGLREEEQRRLSLISAILHPSRRHDWLIALSWHAHELRPGQCWEACPVGD